MRVRLFLDIRHVMTKADKIKMCMYTVCLGLNIMVTYLKNDSIFPLFILVFFFYFNSQ